MIRSPGPDPHASQRLQSGYFSNVKYRGPFDPVVAAYADPKIEFIERHVGCAIDSVLDVGCGNGIFTARFARSCPDVTGLDYSGHLLSENPHRNLICGDATSLPFPDESFDLVFEANVLHHVDRRESVVREMARTSRRYVVLLEPNRNNPLMFAFSLAVRAERGCLASTMSRLTTEARECGLRVIATRTTGMISQNNTPAGAIPLLKRFDGDFQFGEYLVVIAEKQNPGRQGN